MTHRTILFVSLLLPAGAFAQPDPCDSLDGAFSFNLVGGNTVVFQAGTFDNQWSYLWDFGDGSSDYGPVVTHGYQGPTLFQACLTVWAWDPFLQDTCFASTCQLVDLTGQGNPCDSLLQACFIPTGGQSVFFNNCTITPDLPNTQFFWDFGDGSSSNQIAPAHTFSPGVWTVCLTALWQNCLDTLCQTVTVTGGGTPCDSTFSAGFNTSLNGSVATFSATSSLPANGFIWDFGDGTQGGGANVGHVYAPGGPYTVCLQAWYWNGSDTCWTVPVCQIVGPFAQNNPCDSLDGAFSFNLAGGNTVVFQAGTFDNQWSYLWDFGDGSSDYGPVVTHGYQGPTLFQACLTVWAWDPFLQDTCFASTCQVVDLTGQGGPCDSLGLDASFTWTSQGTVFFFQDQSQTGGLPATHLWTFGDGGQAFVPDPVYTYLDTTSYQVCLTVGVWTGTDSCFAISCQPVFPGSNGPQGVGDQGFPGAWWAGPNPTTDRLLIGTPGTPGPRRATVMDLSGRVVLATGDTGPERLELDVRELPAGIYLVGVRAGGRQRTFRLLRE